MEKQLRKYIMKIQSFDKVTLRALRSEMQAVLDKYGAQSNVAFEVGNMKFSEAEVDIKVSAKVKGATTRTDKMLQMYAEMAGITSFTNSRGDKLIGYKAANRKYPFVYQGVDGRRYKCDERQAKMLFA